ncbi:MAG: hypothetical protein A4E39_00467 [Methanoregulaceae archaeon PtaB.Bin152]|nr:MAG: hypothetical protein A4E39_00467 [Methanoregulaceae archaeon PtaB.Bin152]
MRSMLRSDRGVPRRVRNRWIDSMNVVFHDISLSRRLMNGVRVLYSPWATRWMAFGSVIPLSFIPARSRKKFGRASSRFFIRLLSRKSMIATGTIATRMEMMTISSTRVVVKSTLIP